MRRKGFAHPEGEAPLTIYGTAPTERKLRVHIDMTAREKEGRLLFQRVVPFEMIEIEAYRVTPLMADHDPACEPVFYLVQDGRCSILYANDTGWFPDETWAFLEREKPLLDFVSLDCTCILTDCRHNHMDLKTCVEVKARILALGCANGDTRFCLHHFSHNGLAIYDELVPLAEKEGFDVSYDGMMIDLTPCCRLP